MIQITIETNKDEQIIGYSVIGHANIAPKGQDIYCAGISSLAQSTYMCLENYLKKAIIGESGKGRLVLKLKDKPDEKTETAFQVMLIGFREIEKLVPKAVKIVFKEVDN